jgi:hypothetical protein
MSRWIGETRVLTLASALVVLTAGFPRTGQTSILEQMTGELRLHAPAECGRWYDDLEDASFGRFFLDQGEPGGGSGTVSFSTSDGTLTAEWVRTNAVRGVDPSTGRPVVPSTINANAFDAICENARGPTSLDPNVCDLSLFNSQNPVIPTDPLSPTIAVAGGDIMSGQDPDAAFPLPTAGGGLFLGLAAYGPAAQALMRSATAGHNGLPNGARTPLVSLVVGPNDGPAANHPQPLQNLFTQWGLSPVLTDEQEALLGCGPFYGNNCDIDGVGLMESELSALLQSWPLPDAEPVCTRYDGSMTSVLPGCRGAGDSGYDIHIDGSTFGNDLLGFPYQRVHPFSGEQWASEMAIFSWNYLKLLVLFSFATDPTIALPSQFDPDDPLRVDACSFANPLACCRVAQHLSITTRAPEDASQPPLRHWLWETGAEYLVTEATGDLEDFLGWTMFAFGPERSRVSGSEVGVPFLLSPPGPLSPIPDSPLIVSHPGADGVDGTTDDSFAGIVYGVVLPLRLVEIDIKPHDDSNSINPFNRGLLPVAILGSATFDVADVDVATLAFGPDGGTPAFDLSKPLVYWLSQWDVDADGTKDLLSYYRTAEAGIAMGDPEACLTGETLDGVSFKGCDSVNTNTSPWSCGLGAELALLLPLLMWLRRTRSGEAGS